MIEERIVTGGVPAKLYDPGAAPGLLLFGHGGTQSKDRDHVVSLCRRYAEGTGLAVVCIDAVDHGERAAKKSRPGLPSHWHSGATVRMVCDWQVTAEALSSIGPALAYVGFSMGMIFGAPTVATLPSVNAVVFGFGGIPGGTWIDDPALRSMLLESASGLGHAEVLMVNATRDEQFPTEGTHAFFDAIPGERKTLLFWEGGHADWPDEAIERSVEFVREHSSGR